ncbi:hypothetical protein ABKN59_006919 [Abortiporus biennis]
MKESLRHGSIQTIFRPTEDDADTVDFKIKDVTCIGSYSWVNKSEPTILVPGAPPIWLNKELPFKVELDSGGKFIDQNGFRTPSSQHLASFIAIDVLQGEEGAEEIDWSKVDIVTGRNSLRQLLRWVNGEERGGEVRDFRIDTHLAGKKTILLDRWEARTLERPGEFTGYGHNFEEVSTKPVAGCEGAVGNHRIIKYDFDGMTIVVSFEVDAFLESEKADKPKPTQSPGEVDDLSNLLSGLAVSSSLPQSQLPEDSPGDIKVIRAGCTVAQEDIVEMVTRSQRNAANFDWDHVYPQVFFSQTPHLFLAIHNRGVFEEVQKEVLGSPKMKSVERNLETGLKKLRSALETIQNLVIDHGKNGWLTLICQEGELRVYERVSNQKCLPADIMARFDE